MPIVTDLDRIRSILETSNVVAILGANPKPGRAAQYVPEYLAEHGYRILPVNPLHTDKRLWGEPVRPTLTELDQPVDLVDVFRRASHLPDHLDEILGMNPLPKVVWFQLGIRNDAVAQQLSDAGLEVVQDRCTLADHRRLGLAKAPR